MQMGHNPSFSGKYNDEIGLKWYMNNVSNFLVTKKISFKKKMMLWSIKKGSNYDLGLDGIAYRIYGCGTYTDSPEIVIPLESTIVLPD